MKLIFTCFFSLITILSFAQTAQDFDLNDINGAPFNLYEKLDANKAVLIDFSATWCGPCWGLHNSGILEDLYDTYGPEGEDILDVIYVECDPDTNDDCLYGLSTCSGTTQGDWVTGTKYRFFNPNNTIVQSAYGIGAYPTIVIVSAVDKSILYKSSSYSYAELENTILKYGVLKKDLDLEVKKVTASKTACDNFQVFADIRNVSLVDTDNVEVELYVNNTLIDTKTITENIPSSGTVSIEFDDVPATQAKNNKVKVVVNLDDAEVSNNERNKFVDKGEGDNKVNVLIKKGAKQGLTKYKIYDGNGDVFAESGTINPAKDHDVTYTIPEEGCIEIVFTDSANKGIVGANSVVLSDSEHAFYVGDAEGGLTSFGYNVATIVNQKDIEQLSQLSLYPNPVNDQVTIDYQLNEKSDLAIDIFNHLGKKVASKTIANQGIGRHSVNFDTNDFPAGIYVTQITINGDIEIQRFVKQ